MLTDWGARRLRLGITSLGALCAIAASLGILRCTNSGSRDAPSDAGDSGREASVDAASDTDATPDVAPGDDAVADAAGEVDVTESGVAWSPVPGAAACGLFQADPTIVNFGARTWTDCGSGCRVGSASLAGFGQPSVDASAGRFVSGDDILLTFAASPTGNTALVTRLSDDRVLAAVEQRANPTQCGIGRNTTTPLVLPWYYVSGGKSQRLFGWVSITGQLQWNPNWLAEPNSTPLSMFAWDGGVGMTFDDATILRAAGAAATKYSTIESGLQPAYHAAGDGPLAAWTESNSLGGESLRGISSGGNPTELVASKDGLHAVALLGSRLVWIGTHGPSWSTGSYTSAEWHFSDWSGSTVVDATGPSLPATSGLTDVQAMGDYGATIGCQDGITGRASCSLFVVRFSDGQSWQVHARPGMTYQKIMMVSPTEVIVGEADYPPTAGSAGLMPRLVRFSLASLSQLASAL